MASRATGSHTTNSSVRDRQKPKDGADCLRVFIEGAETRIRH